MEITDNRQKVFVVKTDFHSNFDSPFFLHNTYESALNTFSRLIKENYTLDQLVDPSSEISLNFEEGYFEINKSFAPDNICIEEHFIEP